MTSSISIQRWMMSALLCGAGAMGCCRADTIFLNDGREVNGTIVNEDPQTVVIKTTRGSTRSIRRSEIETIVREKLKVVEKEIPKTLVVTDPAPILPVRPGAPNTAGEVVGRKPPAPVTPVAPVGPQARVKNNVSSPDGVASTPAVSPQQVAPPGPPPSNPVVNAPPTSTRDLASSGENPMPGFPEYSKRMSVRKEALLRDALDTIKVAWKNPEDTTRAGALSDIQALGSEVIPYLWAGIQNDDAEVRAACMKLIGVMNGRTCTKRVIETFYMTMPEASIAATWNVPFVDEMIKTVSSITGQTFITVEARRLGVQDGLKKYIDWYKLNFKSMPRQIGEPELDPNDPMYDSKLTALRELKLSKREWSHAGSLPTDLVAGPSKDSPAKGPTPDIEREVDKKYGDTVPTVSDDKALKRSVDQPGAPEDDQALKRPVDRRVEQVPSAPQNSRRDPPSEVPSQSTELPKDPLLRPQDVRRQQQ